MQFAYQPGKSTDYALYTLTHDKCLAYKETALAVFLDIEGTFNKFPIHVIVNVLAEKGVNVMVIS